MYSAGVDSFSAWLKTKKPAEQLPSTIEPSPSSSSSSSSSSLLSSSPVNTTRDRLLHSEIRELQSKLAQIEKENHELRQLLAKTSGADPRTVLLRRQVHEYVQSTCMYINVFFVLLCAFSACIRTCTCICECST